MGQPVNATFGSVVFLHLLHSGGTTLRQLFSQQLCDDGYGLRCWEGRGRGIPAPAEARRPLDALYGHFPFQPAKFAKVTVNPFYLTVLADPWDVLRSGYFHMKLRKDEAQRDVVGVELVLRRLGRVEVDEGLGSTRAIQRRFNVSVPRARVPEKASTLRDRSER